MAGKFIIIEGTDGSGKTTQLTLLKKWLEESGIKTKTLDFPQYDEFWGKMVGRFLRGEFGELDDVNPYLPSVLFMLDQASQSRRVQKWLKEGYYVLSNRYVQSSMAHQSAKFKSEKDQREYLKWLEDAAFKELGLVKDDLTVVLYANPDILRELSLKSRVRKKSYTITKDIAEDHATHQQDSARMYAKLCQQKETWQLLNCMDEVGRLLPIETIHQKLKELVAGIFGIDGNLGNGKELNNTIDSKNQLKLV